MDRMLHRGKYADEESEAIVKRSKITILEKLGIEKTFSRHDKFTYAVCIGWPLLVFTIVIVGTIYNLVINKNVSDEAWLKFWHIWIGVTLVVVTGTTIWFIIGGFKNLIDMFRRLNAAKMDTSDDGTVVKTDEAEE